MKLRQRSSEQNDDQRDDIGILMAGAALLALRIGNTRQAAPLVMVSAE